MKEDEWTGKPIGETGWPEESDEALEAALRQAMRRVDAPASLARSLAAALAAEFAAEPSPRRSWWARGTAAEALSGRAGTGWGWLQGVPLRGFGTAAAALAIATLLAGSVHLHEQHRRQQATREFDESVRITEQTMEHTRDQLRRAGIALDGDAALGQR